MVDYLVSVCISVFGNGTVCTKSRIEHLGSGKKVDLQNIFQYCNTSRLEDFGYAVGIRVAELQLYREKPGKRETKLLAMLQVRFSIGTYKH